MAGINAALAALGKAPFILNRSEAYIGVLIDDLVTKGVTEPYRMYTSRAEYRLLLREDNADLRLREKGYRLGLIGAADWRKTQKNQVAIEKALARLSSFKLKPSSGINRVLLSLSSRPIRKTITLKELLRRPEIVFRDLSGFDPPAARVKKEIGFQVEIQVKYEGFLERQKQEVEKFQKLEGIKIPPDFDYQSIPGLSGEVREKLNQFRPASLGQASRIPGITPAAISVLMVYLNKKKIRPAEFAIPEKGKGSVF